MIGGKGLGVPLADLQAEMKSRHFRNQRGTTPALTEKDVIIAKILRRRGQTMQQVADRFKVHRATLRKYLDGRRVPKC